MKKPFSLILVLCMIVGLLPAMSLAANAATDYIYVGGVQMDSGTYLANGATATTTTKPSGGYAHYSNGTLTLSNYQYTGAGHTYDYSSTRTLHSVIYASKFLSVTPLTVVLYGENTLISTEENGVGIDVDGAGVIVKEAETGGSLTVSGGRYSILANTCVIDGGNLVFQSCLTYGIYTSSTLTVNDGTITVNSDGYGLYAYSDVTINGGIISATTGGVGMRAQVGSLTVNGGEVTIEATNYGIRVGEQMIVNDGKVDISSVTTQDDTYCAVEYGSDGSFETATSAVVKASTAFDGELTDYVADDHATYDRIYVFVPEMIRRAVATVPKPIIGQTPNFDTASVRLNDDTCTVTEVQWYRSIGAGMMESLESTNIFTEEDIYICRLYLTPKDGYTFPSDYGNGVIASINGVDADKNPHSTTQLLIISTRMTAVSPSFTSIPDMLEAYSGDDVTITWSTNFTPVRVGVAKDYGDTSPVWLDDPSQGEYTIRLPKYNGSAVIYTVTVRAYYGTGSGDYVSKQVLVRQLSGVLISGALTGINGQPGTVRLIPEGETEARYSVPWESGTTTYRVADVKPGTYTLQIRPDYFSIQSKTITVGSEAQTHDFDMKWYVNGEVSGVKDTDVVTISLYRQGETTVAYSTTVVGNGSYSIDMIERGAVYDVVATCPGYEKNVMKTPLSATGSRYFTMVPLSTVLGDINLDGNVNMIDAFTVYSAVSSGAVTDAIKTYADMNGDGTLNMIDAFLLYKIASGT